LAKLEGERLADKVINWHALHGNIHTQHVFKKSYAVFYLGLFLMYFA
jgi:hypothetical protein